MIIGIVAVSQNLAIGKDGKIPWHYSSDLKFFKQTTSGNVIVMGRKTFDSIGKPLPNRLNVVMSRSNEIEKTIVLRSKEEVLQLAEYLKGDIFIIGGANIYQEFADVIEKWLVTEIPLVIEEADAFMNEDFLEGFAKTEQFQLEENLFVKTYLRK